MNKIKNLILLFTFVCSPQIISGEKDFIEGVSDQLNLERYTKESLQSADVKRFSAFIYTVLSNTQELRIHQMNGETTNQVYIRDEGQEAVFRFEHDENGKKIDGTGTLVTDCLNRGSFNYYHPYKAPLGHFSADMLPWLLWGNCREDPSTLNQRVEAYMLDFREGYARTAGLNNGFYLPEDFKYKETGQSEAVAFFAKALHKSDFDFDASFPDLFKSREKQAEFFKALEDGIKALLDDV